MGWTLAEDRGLLLAAGALPGAPGRDRRAEHRRVRPRRGPQAVHADQAGRPHDPAQRAARPALGRPRTASGCCTTSTSTCAASTPSTARTACNVKRWTRVDVFAANALAGQLFGAGGGQEAQRSELLSSLQRRLGARRGHAAVRRPDRVQRRRRPGDADQVVPVRRPCRAGTRAASRSTPARSGSPIARSRPRATVRRRWASNFLMVSAQALGDRAPAVRRRPADRLLLSRPHARGRRQGPGRSRRAARPRPASPATS